MRNELTKSVILVASVLASPSMAVLAQATAPLKLAQIITLPGYSGDFDHFAVDSQRGRLLLAAEDHATLEVFDLNTAKHLRTVGGFDAPHSILVRSNAQTILVTDSGKTMTKILDADSYNHKGTIPLVEGADSAGYDAQRNIYYIVTGGKDVYMKTAQIEAVNPDSGQRLGSVTFNDNHVEAMALEKTGNLLFVNLAQTNKLAVVDRSTMKEIAEWPIKPCGQNAMIALDEARKRLYIVCRQPGMVVVMNADNGSTLSTSPAPLRADDVLFDAAANRLYVPGGEGHIGVYDTTNADKVSLIANVSTAPGAKTGILLSDRKQLVLAVSPGETKAVAKILVYDIQ